jgi:hypothetical protein
MDNELSPMSFREKSAWVSLVSIVLVFGAYFSYVGMVLAGLARNRLALFPVIVGVFIVAEVVLHVVIATQSPRDARTPRDERERLIELKAMRPAFYVLLVCALGSIATAHVRLSDADDHLWVMRQAVLFSIVLAEAVKFAGQIVLYRRDA